MTTLSHLLCRLAGPPVTFDAEGEADPVEPWLHEFSQGYSPDLEPIWPASQSSEELTTGVLDQMLTELADDIPPCEWDPPDNQDSIDCRPFANLPWANESYMVTFLRQFYSDGIEPENLGIFRSNRNLVVSDEAHGKAEEKRHRSRDWNTEEKDAFVEVREEALKAVKGKPWEFISRTLWERYRIERSADVCEDFWYTIRKAFRAIQAHESAKSSTGAVSYWEMSEHERSRHKLPRVFSIEWWKSIERIFAAQEKPSRKKREKPSKKKIRVTAMHESPGDDDDVGFSTQQPQTEWPPMSNDVEMSAQQQLVEEAVDSALLRRTSGNSSGATPEENDLVTRLSPLVKQLVADAISSALRPLASKQNSNSTIDEDNLIPRLAPLIGKQVEEAVSSALMPFSSVLQRLEQEEREFQEEVRAFAEKKRAVALEETQLQLKKHQRIGRQGNLRAFKQHGLRVTKSGVIPALKGINIGRDEDNVDSILEDL